MTLGEVMYSITGLQFSFTQAPESMRSVLQGCWQLTIAVGNLVVLFVVGASLLSQMWEFFLFALIMFLAMIIFMVLAYRYKPIPPDMLDVSEEVEKEEKKSPLEIESSDL
jgi:solute carrier family 15 oligopeptide transporter 1